MIPTLYDIFKPWSDGGSVYLLSDTHFDDADCKLMDPMWIPPEQQVEQINNIVKPGDTFICLGDVGNPDYIGLFDEIYSGPLFIADKILLSHEPVYGLSWCLNIHGHDHSNMEKYSDGCKHLNVAANVCDYTPVNLGLLIKNGILSSIESIHRETINRASGK